MKNTIIFLNILAKYTKWLYFNDAIKNIEKQLDSFLKPGNKKGLPVSPAKDRPVGQFTNARKGRIDV